MSTTTHPRYTSPAKKRRDAVTLLNPKLLIPAAGRAVTMMNPVTMMRNPVMMVTELGAALTTLATIAAAANGNDGFGYFLAITVCFG